MKLLILGNSGSGKTTLAKRLLKTGAVEAVLPMDDVAWAEPMQRAATVDSVSAIETFANEHKSWAIEGCYGVLAENALPLIDTLYFLNPGIEVCLENCRQRPWEPDKYDSASEQDSMLRNLLQWVSQYNARDDEFGLRWHQDIFRKFSGEKQAFTALADYPK